MSNLTLGTALLATVLGFGPTAATSMIEGLPGVHLAPVVARADLSPRSARLVSSQWLAENLANPDLVLLHVGDGEGYRRHIPGARLVSGRDLGVTGPDGRSLEMPAPDELRTRLEALGITDHSRIVVYYGQDWVSPATRIIFALGEAGFEDRTALLDGGMAGWAAEGRPMSSDPVSSPTGQITLQPPPSRIVDHAFVSAHVGRPGFVLIDVRAEEFFTGATPGGTRQKQVRGHIPGAVSLPFTRMTDEDLRLESPERLAEAFSRAGVRPGDTIIAYCHIGQQATAVLFAAQTLGYRVLLYDGAFEDWVMRDLPAETAAGA